MKKLLLICGALSLSACVSLPDVYLVDRHTVMETEASGEWPKLEQRFRKEALKMGATDLVKEPDNQRRERAFRTLNAEFTAENNSQAEK